MDREREGTEQDPGSLNGSSAEVGLGLSFPFSLFAFALRVR